jgi:hypothetical protein
MVTFEEALSITTRLLGDPGDPPWKLVEFPAGWLVVKEPGLSERGRVTHAVERESGRVLRFPSRVPPKRIMESYSQVASQASVEEPG